MLADSPPQEVNLHGGKAATLKLTVRDAAGDPVQGAEIALVTKGGFEWRVPGRKTDADGTLTLRRIFGGYLDIKEGDEVPGNVGRVVLTYAFGSSGSLAMLLVLVELGKCHLGEFAGTYQVIVGFTFHGLTLSKES